MDTAIAKPADETQPSPWLNPDSPPQARRLTPATLDGILRGAAAGVPYATIARAYGVSLTTVQRVVERSADDPRLASDLSTLSELADAERELREALGDTRVCENLITLVRAGWLLKTDRERK